MEKAEKMNQVSGANMQADVKEVGSSSVHISLSEDYRLLANEKAIEPEPTKDNENELLLAKPNPEAIVVVQPDVQQTLDTNKVKGQQEPQKVIEIEQGSSSDYLPTDEELRLGFHLIQLSHLASTKAAEMHAYYPPN